jgi:hypothetical protein
MGGSAQFSVMIRTGANCEDHAKAAAPNFNRIHKLIESTRTSKEE